MKIWEIELAIDSKRDEYFEICYDWTDRKVATALAYTNSLLGLMAMGQGALKKLPEGGYKVVKGGVNLLTGLARKGALNFRMALAATQTFLSKYWGEDKVSLRRATLRSLRDELESRFGFFKVATPGWQPGKRETCRYERIQFFHLVVFHEALESLLVHRGWVLQKNEKWGISADFPEHKGFWGALLYQAVFAKIAKKYHRRQESSSLGYMGEEDVFDALFGIGSEEPVEVAAVPEPIETVPEEPVEELEVIQPDQEMQARIAHYQTQINRGSVFAIAARIAIQQNPQWDLYVEESGEVVHVPF